MNATKVNASMDGVLMKSEISSSLGCLYSTPGSVAEPDVQCRVNNAVAAVRSQAGSRSRTIPTVPHTVGKFRGCCFSYGGEADATNSNGKKRPSRPSFSRRSEEHHPQYQ